MRPPILRRRAAAMLLPDERPARYRLYILIASMLYIAAWAMVFARAQVRNTTVDFAVSDAIGYYVYLPTIVIDHDLRFHNQLETQFAHDEVPGQFIHTTEHGGWGVSDEQNRWPIGIALSIAPGFLLGHAISAAAFAISGGSDTFAPNGYTVLYFVFSVAAAMVLGTIAMIATDRLLTERFAFPGRIAAAAVLTYWLGSNFVWFWLREPLVSHLIGASWITLAVYLIHRIDWDTRNAGARLPLWQLPTLALVTSMALICRYSNAFIAPLFVYLLLILVRRGRLVESLRQTPLILVGLLPLVLQGVMLYAMNERAVHGTPQDLGYTRVETFYWTDPALVLSLFSSRRGLFSWTPILLLSVWGLIWHARRSGALRRDPLLASLALSGLILWYVNASWYAWWFGNSAGNRAYIELAPLFIVGFGFAYAWLDGRSTATRRAVFAMIALAVLVNYGVVAGKLTNRLEDHDPLLAWEKRALVGAWERF